MATDLTTGNWSSNGLASVTGNTLVEDTASDRHSVYQDVQSLVNDGVSGNVTYSVTFRPIGRDRFWLGAKNNNGTTMASYYTGAATPVVSSQGSGVASASIVDNGDGTYTARLHFSAFPGTNVVFAFGGLLTDGAQTYTGTGASIAEVTEAWMSNDATEHPYVPTTDRDRYEDQVGGDQDADMPASSAPKAIWTNYLQFETGRNSQVDWLSLSEDLDDFSVMVLAEWDGTTGAEKVLARRWETIGNQRSWRMILNSSGELVVELSGNGSSVAKSYRSNMALDSNELTLCSFTWDGSFLKVYINDTELTGSDLNLDTDNALSGNLHTSTATAGIGEGFFGSIWQDRYYNGVLPSSEVLSVAGALGVSGLPDGSGGGSGSSTWPADTAALITWLGDQGISSSDIRYVDKDHASASDSNAGTSASAPWATIQKAASTLTAGQAVIIAEGGNYYEDVEPGNSGTSGNLIWYVSPGDGIIMDGRDETAMSVTWTSMGNNEWRAPWNLSRYYRTSTSYHNNCVSGATCLDDDIWRGIGIAHGTTQLKRRDGDGGDGPDGPGVPTLNQGDCYFETGTGTQANPQYVHVRLSGNADPNGENMYSFSSRKYSFDWQSQAWHADGFYGGDNETELEDGRSYIGLGGLHFKYHTGTKKTGPTAVRGTGWHVQHCSFSENNSHGLGIHGHDHLITDCYFKNNGLGAFLMEYADGVEMNFCKFERNNLHNYPANWSSGSKISYSGRNTRVDITDCYVINDFACPFWWDIDNFNESTGESFLFKRIFINAASRQGYMLERKTKHVLSEDVVVFNTVAEVSGNSDQKLGAGVRLQAASENSFLRVVFANCDGHGYFDRAADDSRSANNNNTINYLTCVYNGKDSTVDQNPAEVHVGDGKANNNGPTGDVDTTLANNVQVSSRSGVDSFRNDTAGANVTTETPATALAWFKSGSSNFTVDATPGNLVEDHTSETGCYKMAAGKEDFQPQFINGHPKDHVTWSIPT